MQQKVIEKRLRVRQRDDVDRGFAKLNPKTMEFLGITDKVEIVVAGKKRLVFQAISLDTVPLNEVWANADELREHGIADRTIATVRRPLRSKA
ncbi:MAG: hypothetical protein DRJ66_00770 [Thermoprotei archaeon]|nr:MAG: hypothetical protein DRJ66_00770 [Thermoprotei archaeon]RLF18799.1 MAG: hypothetical protein DRZ82_07565 [Thermoprotei archaeon]